MQIVVRSGLGLLFAWFAACSCFGQDSKPIPRAAPLMPGFDVGRPMICTGQVAGGGPLTLAVKGPASKSATLRVYTGDDGAKESHDCMISIYIDMPGVPETGAGNVYNSDDAWNRPFSVRIDGFSQDGKHILGLVSEGGEGAVTEVFDYDDTIVDEVADVADIKPYLARLRRAKCGSSIDIAGTTKDGLVVLEPTTTDPCQAKYRASLNVKTSKLKDFLPQEIFIPLYPARTP